MESCGEPFTTAMPMPSASPTRGAMLSAMASISALMASFSTSEITSMSMVSPMTPDMREAILKVSALKSCQSTTDSTVIWAPGTPAARSSAAASAFFAGSDLS